MPRPTTYNKTKVTALQVHAFLSALDKPTMVEMLLECIPRLAIKEIIFNTWKSGEIKEINYIEAFIKRKSKENK